MKIALNTQVHVNFLDVNKSSLDATRLQSLDKTTNFIEEQWNEGIADNFLKRLDKRIEQLRVPL
ncbi:MAG: hypothetical protein AAF620_19720 [Bacteroidota bacterium]